MLRLTSQLESRNLSLNRLPGASIANSPIADPACHPPLIEQFQHGLRIFSTGLNEIAIGGKVHVAIPIDFGQYSRLDNRQGSRRDVYPLAYLDHFIEFPERDQVLPRQGKVGWRRWSEWIPIDRGNPA